MERWLTVFVVAAVALAGGVASAQGTGDSNVPHFSNYAAAQTGAVLSGVVHDRAGEPVSGVVLTIVDPIDGDTRVAISDSHGTYLVDRLHYGLHYVVDASHPRFRKSRVRARANEGETQVHIALAPPRSRFVSAALFPLRVLTLGVIGRARGNS